MRSSGYKRALAQAGILVLLLGVACLSTVIKHSQYLPESHPIHYIAKASKMNVSDAPLLGAPASVYSVSWLTPPLCEFSGMWTAPADNFDFPQLSLTLSFQHRSPPASLI